MSVLTRSGGVQATMKTGAELTADRIKLITDAAQAIPAGTTVMSDKPKSISELEFKFLQAKKAPTHPDLYLQLCYAFRIHDERHASEGHEGISAKNMAAQMGDDAIRVMAYASRGMQQGDVDNFLASSFKSGLPNPISTALPSMLTFGASSFISSIHGPWAGFASALAFAAGKPFMAGGMQPAIVSLCDSIRGRNAPTVLAKGEVNDEVWLDAAAKTLEGMSKDTHTAIATFETALNDAMASMPKDAKDLTTEAGLQKFINELSDDHQTKMRTALEGLNNVLKNSSTQTVDALNAMEQASRPSLIDQRTKTLSAEFASKRQDTGNKLQQIPRTIRPFGSTITGMLSGMKPEEMPEHPDTAIHRLSHFANSNPFASAAVGTSYAAAVSLLQSPLAGKDEQNKQAFNVKAAIVFYDAFTPEGKQRYERGETMDAGRDIDEGKLRGVFTSVSEYMVKSTQENLNQRKKDLAAEITKGTTLDLAHLPEDTASIMPQDMREKVDRYKALVADLAAVTQGIRNKTEDFLTSLPDREVKQAFHNCVTNGAKHVLENMTNVKYSKAGELQAQWTQKVSTDVSMFGLAGQFTPSIVNKLAAAICGGAGNVPNAVVGFLGFYNLAASFTGAQSQYAAISSKNHGREALKPKPSATTTFIQGNLAPVMQTRANQRTAKALDSAGKGINAGLEILESPIATELLNSGLRLRRNNARNPKDPDQIDNA